jgi:hypothetical protein
MAGAVEPAVPAKHADTAVQASPTPAKLAQPNGQAGPEYNPFISIYSLLLTALQLAENFDTHAGKEDRVAAIDKLAIEFRKLSAIKGG